MVVHIIIVVVDVVGVVVDVDLIRFVALANMHKEYHAGPQFKVKFP